MLSSAIGPIFDILSFSTIIVLVVIGLGVIASMMGVFNFAHGEFVTIGAYTTYLAHTLGAPVWFGMMLAPIVAGLFGLILEIAIVRRLYQNPVAAMLATWAVGLAMRETVRILTAGLYISVPEPITGSIVLGATSVSAWRCVIMAITVLVVLGSWLLLSKTSFGLQVRAALENPALARSSGLSTSVIYCATFTFGTALAGLAGALIVPVYSLFADLGLRFVIQGFVSILIGGLGSFTGPLLGGSIIGVFGSGMPWVISPVTTDIFSFPSFSWFGTDLYEGTAYFYLCLSLFVAAYLLVRIITRSQLGLVLSAIRENEARVQHFGYNVGALKIAAFVLAGAIAGLGGVLMTFHDAFISPSSVGVVLSTQAVIYVLLGGSGTRIGAVLGVVLIEGLSFWLTDNYREIWPIILALVLLAIVMIRPAGLVSLFVSEAERAGSFGARLRGPK